MKRKLNVGSPTIDEHSKEVVDYMIDSEYKRVRLSMKKPHSRMLKIDCFAQPASAGTGNILDSVYCCGKVIGTVE